VTVNEVRTRVEVIRAAAESEDDEVAHSKQDDLYVAVLRAISSRATNDPARLAHEALKVQEIRFARWMA